MIRRRGREADESLSFLDIITYGFGAIIMLLIITKPVPNDTDFSKQQRDLSAMITQSVDQVAALQQQLEGLESDLSSIPDPSQQSADVTLETSIQLARQALEELKSSNQALEIVKKSAQKASITQTTAPLQRDPEVGGIPVDGEYVIFIVDTSGSMLQIWSKVVDVVNRIVDIHPRVKGFQIMNDNGNYMLPSTKRKWLPDTPKSRENVKKLMYSWGSFSDSNPADGLEAALRDYRGTREKMSIYVIGDDFTGSSYDEVINAVRSKNIDKITGQAKVRVHAIGLISEVSTDRYSTLMRNVVERNRGAFIGLPN